MAIRRILGTLHQGTQYIRACSGILELLDFFGILDQLIHSSITFLLFEFCSFQRNQQTMRASRPEGSSASSSLPANATCPTNVVSCYQLLVSELDEFLRPMQAAESSVLVDVLHFPEKLFTVGGNATAHRELLCEGEGVRAK